MGLVKLAREQVPRKIRSIDLNVTMWIGERSFDLSKGTMFLVSIGEVDLQVEQLQRDLSGLDPSIEAISTLADSEPDVANFISGREIGSD